MLERHRQEHGEYPRKIALVIWGTSNMRTGGDDIAQALWLWGCEPVWEESSGRVVDFRILPLGLLGRPSIDLLLRVSGLFRDAFGDTLRLLAAIVGMEDAKRSLIYHAIDPKIGGALLLGHRGCAKTTLVRAFAEVLQASSAQPVPFVELPLGATEDRLLGSVSAETLVEQNRWETRIGLIEEANGGVLYVDEINLLPDHLADQFWTRLRLVNTTWSATE